MQLEMNADCGCEGVDIVDVNVVFCSFCPPPVSQVQKMLGGERTVRRETTCGGEVTQEVTALASVVPLQS